MEFQRLDIVQLINNSPLSKLSTGGQTDLIAKIGNNFKEQEQQLFVASFYCYLNHDSKKDFIINLDDVWKWCGFSRKDHAKTLLYKHFNKESDYKIFASEVAGAKFDHELAPQKYGTTENSILNNEKENENRGGHNKETILMTVNTFKKFCLKAGTKRADEIHDYYIRLEEILHESLNEETQRLKNELEQKEKKLEEQQKQIQLLENKPETEGFCQKPGYIYIIKDTATSNIYKIGLGEDANKRFMALNTSCSQKSLKLINIFETYNTKNAEKIIHLILEPFKIRKRNEWFVFCNDVELNYAIHVIKHAIEITDKYNFIDYDSFKNYAETLGTQQIDLKESPKYTNSNFLAKTNKISNYNGVTWCIKTEKWTARLTKNNNTIFLGDYKTELEAAVVYNDYASYLNKTDNMNYKLNDIPDYKPNPRDVPDDNKKIKYQNKTSKYIGVYFIKSKQIFEASIQYKKKSYKLIKNLNDTECAKVYNQQVLYFNNHLGTNYKLNDISDFITIEKNHISDLEISKVKKFSRFIGVSIRNDCNKFRAYIKHNRKRIDCGTFQNEEDAARAYNKKAEELNQLETTKIKYQLNVI